LLRRRFMVLPGPNHSLRIMLEQAAKAAKVPLKLDIEVNTLPLQIDLVRRGQVYTVLPLATVIRQVDNRELAAWPIARPTLARKLVLGSPADRPTSLASLRLQQLVAETVKELIASGDWPGAESVAV